MYVSTYRKEVDKRKATINYRKGSQSKRVRPS